MRRCPSPAPSLMRCCCPMAWSRCSTARSAASRAAASTAAAQPRSRPTRRCCTTPRSLRGSASPRWQAAPSSGEGCTRCCRHGSGAATACTRAPQHAPARLADAPLPPRTRGRRRPRSFYHSNALLLPSGDIWVAGSEQAECVDNCKEGGLAPPDQEYRAELLQLPYAFGPRPEITSISADAVKYGGSLTIKFKSESPISFVSVIPPGANTHSLNMMQRVVYLRIGNRGKDFVTVSMPSWSDRVLNPGYYMLWVVDEKRAPAKEARWIQLTA